jgi:hypothetical protein
MVAPIPNGGARQAQPARDLAVILAGIDQFESLRADGVRVHEHMFVLSPDRNKAGLAWVHVPETRSTA